METYYSFTVVKLSNITKWEGGERREGDLEFDEGISLTVIAADRTVRGGLRPNAAESNRPRRRSRRRLSPRSSHIPSNSKPMTKFGSCFPVFGLTRTERREKSLEFRRWRWRIWNDYSSIKDSTTHHRRQKSPSSSLSPRSSIGWVVRFELGKFKHQTSKASILDPRNFLFLICFFNFPF